MQFLRDENGATAIEYAFIVALIFLAIVGGVTVLGQENKKSYEDTAAKVNSAMH